MFFKNILTRGNMLPKRFKTPKTSRAMPNMGHPIKMITTTMMTGGGDRTIIDATTTMTMIPPTTMAVGVRVMDATTIMMPIIDTTS